jgi:hypothetical protein
MMDRLGYDFDGAAAALGRARTSYGWFRGTFMVFRRRKSITFA